MNVVGGGGQNNTEQKISAGEAVPFIRLLGFNVPILSPPFASRVSARPISRRASGTFATVELTVCRDDGGTKITVCRHEQIGHGQGHGQHNITRTDIQTDKQTDRQQRQKA